MSLIARPSGLLIVKNGRIVGVPTGKASSCPCCGPVGCGGYWKVTACPKPAGSCGGKWTGFMCIGTTCPNGTPITNGQVVRFQGFYGCGTVNTTKVYEPSELPPNALILGPTPGGGGVPIVQCKTSCEGGGCDVDGWIRLKPCVCSTSYNLMPPAYVCCARVAASQALGNNCPTFGFTVNGIAYCGTPDPALEPVALPPPGSYLFECNGPGSTLKCCECCANAVFSNPNTAPCMHLGPNTFLSKSAYDDCAGTSEQKWNTESCCIKLPVTFQGIARWERHYCTNLSDYQLDEWEVKATQTGSFPTDPVNYQIIRRFKSCGDPEPSEFIEDHVGTSQNLAFALGPRFPGPGLDKLTSLTSCFEHESFGGGNECGTSQFYDTYTQTWTITGSAGQCGQCGGGPVAPGGPVIGPGSPQGTGPLGPGIILGGTGDGGGGAGGCGSCNKSPDEAEAIKRALGL